MRKNVTQTLSWWILWGSHGDYFQRRWSTMVTWTKSRCHKLRLWLWIISGGGAINWSANNCLRDQIIRGNLFSQMEVLSHGGAGRETNRLVVRFQPSGSECSSIAEANLPILPASPTSPGYVPARTHLRTSWLGDHMGNVGNIFSFSLCFPRMPPSLPPP